MAPEALPPITDLLAELLISKDGALALEPASQEKLRIALKEHFGKPTLRAAVVSLLKFAAFLQCKKRSPDAANAVVEVLKSAREAMQTSGVSLDALAKDADATRKLQDVLGGPEAKKTNPKPGAPTKKWWETR